MDLLVSGDGTLRWLGKTYSCRLGKNGLTDTKIEGDGCTPVGRFPVRCLYYRPDRIAPPKTDIPIHALSPSDGWCDDPADPNYNRHVTLPYEAGHEEMWRDDGLYDLIVVLGYNDAPPIPGKGSAIFFHVAHPEGKPTQGCVAVALADLMEIVSSLKPAHYLTIRP